MKTNQERLYKNQEAYNEKKFLLMKQELVDIKEEHKKFKKLSERYLSWKYKGSLVQKIIANKFLEKKYNEQKESVGKKFEEWKKKWKK